MSLLRDQVPGFGSTVKSSTQENSRINNCINNYVCKPVHVETNSENKLS